MAFTTINKSSDFFNTLLYAGTSATWTAHSGLGFQPNFTWHKSRTSTGWHGFCDSVRGVDASSGCKAVYSNSNNAEESSTSEYLDGYQSDGFTVGLNGTFGANGEDYAAWCWKMGTSSGITTNGSTNITPLGYSFNATASQSIIYYNGNQTGGDKVPHGLGVKPSLIIVKDVVDANSWNVYHVSNGATKYMLLDSSETVNTNTNRWNDTEPDSVNFTLGASAAVNGNDNNYIAYCFANKRGYSRAGKYTGDGASSGQFIYTGFKPSFILVKCETHAEPWLLWDNKRAGYNVKNYRLNPNQNVVENTSDEIDLLSNGFKFRSSGAHLNGDGRTYIYMAFGQTIVGTNNIPATAR